MFEQFVQNVLGEVHLIAEAPLVFGAAVFFSGRNNLGDAEVALFRHD
jgi:hypothetical protein